MNFVSPIENIMLKIGPTLITGAVILTTRPDLDTLLRQFTAIVDHVPRLRSKFAPFWGWHVRQPAPLDLSRHVARLDDPSITGPEHLEAVLEKLRCVLLPRDRPPWLMVVLNPAEPGTQPGRGLSALLFHFDHSIADGIRALEVITRLASHPVIASAVAKAGRRDGARHRLTRFEDIAPDDRIQPLPLACVSAELAELKLSRGPGYDLSDQVIGAIDRILDDGELFDQQGTKRGKVALVRLTQRRVEARQLGNHVAVVDRGSVARQARGAAARRGMLPSLKTERTTLARQIWGSPLPRSLSRLMTPPVVRAVRRSADDHSRRPRPEVLR